MSEEQFFKDKPETNIFILVLQKYLPFWPLFLIFTAISLSVTWLYLRSQTRIYQASAKVLAIAGKVFDEILSMGL